VAKEMEAAEREVVMFEVQEWTPPEKPEPKEKPTPVSLAVGAVDALVAELTKVADADPDALTDLDRLVEALDRLKVATAKARTTVRRAEAKALLREVGQG
jgi:hypothetical protein